LDTADFPTRIQKTTISATDNSFIDFSRQGNIVIFPIFYGLSDQDAQLITIHDIGLYDKIYNITNIIFTDDPSIIVMDSNIVDFQLNIKVVFEREMMYQRDALKFSLL
jgi:hypothetical protein